MRIGILGGTFDPVHYGHLLLAECCREQQRLDQVWFLPALQPPHKHPGGISSPPQRVEMLRLALAGNEAFVISTLELDRGGISYTVDTLAEIQARHPDDELFLLLGADSLADLPHWRQPQRICQLALPVAVTRPGFQEPDFTVLQDLVTAERFGQIQAARTEMPQVDFSSTDLRNRARQGHSLRYRTPRAVERYIATHRLYLDAGSD